MGDETAGQRQIERLKRRIAKLEAERTGDEVDSSGPDEDGECDLPFIPSKRAGDDLTLKGQ